MKLQAHHKKNDKFSQIDKFILIPKKNWDDFQLGESSYTINGKQINLRVYDCPCDCSGKMHSHRIIDLRDAWEDLALSDGANVNIDR